MIKGIHVHSIWINVHKFTWHVIATFIYSLAMKGFQIRKTEAHKVNNWFNQCGVSVNYFLYILNDL